MWNTVLAICAFAIWPLTLTFVVYATGRGVLFLDWKTFVIALGIFITVTYTTIILGVLSD